MSKRNAYILIAVILLVILIVVVVIVKRKKIQEYVKNTVWDIISEDRINSLHPLVRQQAVNFINEAEKQGIKLRVTSGYRTYEEQNKLYAQGRTAPGNIVTYARGGESSHNFGTAFDVVPIVNGTADYNSTEWSKIGALGKSFGFAWGGDWTNIVDKPHFENNFGFSIPQLAALHNAGNVDNNGYVTIS